jgi:hypothetical protein
MTEVESAGAGLGEDPARAPPLGEGAPANMLFLGPSIGADAVQRLMESVSGPSPLLTVSLLRSPTEQLAEWEQRWRAPPDEVALIGCNNGGGTLGDRDPETEFRATTVADPGDLTGLGIRIGECLEAWGDQTPLVVFDSVTTMLQYADTKQVFQFLHVLTSQLRSAGALSVFHMDPEAHDERTVSTIRSLFRGVYEQTEDGWERV